MLYCLFVEYLSYLLTIPPRLIMARYENVSHYEMFLRRDIRNGIQSISILDVEDKHYLKLECIELYVVDTHNVHIVDQHVEFINTKVNSDLKDEDDTIKDRELNGICFVRVSSVGNRIELYCEEDDTKQSLFVNQPC
mmetsp:Transcript_35333/g.51795  ORF Transcript_35333/g.51795 Transcript_35333/m.51795 type:complete len:137 (+) Transcript_35333:86-496(+)